MARIVNRDLDQSERKLVIQSKIAPTVTGGTYQIGVVPFAAQVLGGYEAALGLSGAPTSQIKVQRFIPGTGVTVITGIFNALTLTAYGTSGLQGHSLVGASFLLMPKDLLFCETGGTNAAVNSTAIAVVIQALEDVKTILGAANSDI